MDSRLLFALLGAVLGLAVSEEPLGLGIGAALGWLFAEIRRLATQVQRLELLLKNSRAAVPSPLPAAPKPDHRSKQLGKKRTSARNVAGYP